LSFSAVQVTKGDVLTEYMESVEDVRLWAAQAQADATYAAQQAALALSGIGVSVADNILTAAEKRSIIADVESIFNESEGIDDTAASWGSDAHVPGDKANYDAAVNALSAYLATLTGPPPNYVAWNSLAGATSLPADGGTPGGAVFLAKFTAVYSTRQTLLNHIADAVNGATAQAALTASWPYVSGVDVTTPQIHDQAATEVYTATSALGFNAGVESVHAEILYTPAFNCKIEMTGSWLTGWTIGSSSQYGTRLVVNDNPTTQDLVSSPYCQIPYSNGSGPGLHQTQQLTYVATAGVPIKLRISGKTGSILFISQITDIILKVVVIKK
jgi:hypothetical protein